MGCHSLPIEIGRHTGIARQDRVCPACDVGAVADERHFVLECAALQTVRDSVPDLVLSAHDSMRVLLWSGDQLKVARYLLALFGKWDDILL